MKSNLPLYKSYMGKIIALKKPEEVKAFRTQIYLRFQNMELRKRFLLILREDECSSEFDPFS
ncbi:hypothetical protein C1H46_000645 [Malus baccata]|uniref:Uncharacterized protein n=1 Tax=Malus baccata TaxID=106549 RepID=A0A540NRG0_MALBA|nr:hypothetical protein C1H46_000645 [Malus baccata]